MSIEEDFRHITINENDDWHYDIPDGYFDNIGGMGFKIYFKTTFLSDTNLVFIF